MLMLEDKGGSREVVYKEDCLQVRKFFKKKNLNQGFLLTQILPGIWQQQRTQEGWILTLS